LNPGSDCTGRGDICDERAQRCGRAQSTLGARTRLAEAAIAAAAASLVHAANASNTSNVTQAPIGSISNIDLAAIFLVIGGLVCIFVFFFLIVQGTRRQAPAILIEHKDGGSQAYRTEMNY
jgi:hypothetical protein